MPPLSLFRLYALRAGYLLIAVGLASTIWPQFLHHDTPWPLMRSVVCCMLTALSLLAILGLRYPVRMLPLLLFEMTWKAIWLLAVALPLWLSHQVDAGIASTAAACLMGAIFPFLIPWRHVFATYAGGQGESWR